MKYGAVSYSFSSGPSQGLKIRWGGGGARSTGRGECAPPSWDRVNLSPLSPLACDSSGTLVDYCGSTWGSLILLLTFQQIYFCYRVYQLAKALCVQVKNQFYYMCFPLVKIRPPNAYLNSTYVAKIWLGIPCFSKIAKARCNSVHIRSLMVSTDQADPSCFYFRISRILMERHWFYFFRLRSFKH